jgi:cephalosporin hydroxylase
MNLTELGTKYGTDKAPHGYLPFYQSILSMLQPRKMLEIGCKEGASLRMWREALPEVELHTLDLFIEHQPPTDIAGLVPWQGDQTNQMLLRALAAEKFDVIIDDGSHNSMDMWVSFDALWHSCRMVYVIEDLHCCNEAFYRQGLTFDQTILGQIKSGAFPYAATVFAGEKIAFILK